jgi:hypothetical protein
MMQLMVLHESQSVYKKTTPNYMNDCRYTRCNDCRKKSVDWPGGSQEIGHVVSQCEHDKEQCKRRMGFPSCPSDIFQLRKKSLCLFLMLESGKRRFAAVMGTILVPQKIYSNSFHKNVHPIEMGSRFINIHPKWTGLRRWASNESTPTVGEGPEEIGPVGPMESSMMEVSKIVNYSKKKSLSIRFCFPTNTRPSTARKEPILIIEILAQLILLKMALAHVKKVSNCNSCASWCVTTAAAVKKHMKIRVVLRQTSMEQQRTLLLILKRGILSPVNGPPSAAKVHQPHNDPIEMQWFAVLLAWEIHPRLSTRGSITHALSISYIIKKPFTKGNVRELDIDRVSCQSLNMKWFCKKYYQKMHGRSVNIFFSTKRPPKFLKSGSLNPQ